MITSWSVLSSLTAYNISFTILGMSLLVSHWWQRHCQCGRRVADWVTAALSHGCSTGKIKASLKRSQIVHSKQLWWLPSFPALAGPHCQLVKMSLEAFAGFHRRQFHPVTAPVRDDLKPIMVVTKEVTTCSVHWWNLVYSVASLSLLHSISHGSSNPSLKLFVEEINVFSW